MKAKCDPEELKSFAIHMDEALRTHPNVVQAEPSIVAHTIKARDEALSKWYSLKPCWAQARRNPLGLSVKNKSSI